MAYRNERARGNFPREGVLVDHVSGDFWNSGFHGPFAKTVSDPVDRPHRAMTNYAISVSNKSRE